MSKQDEWPSKRPDRLEYTSFPKGPIFYEPGAVVVLVLLFVGWVVLALIDPDYDEPADSPQEIQEHTIDE